MSPDPVLLVCPVCRQWSIRDGACINPACSGELCDYQSASEQDGYCVCVRERDHPMPHACIHGALVG